MLVQLVALCLIGTCCCCCLASSFDDFDTVVLDELGPGKTYPNCAELAVFAYQANMITQSRGHTLSVECDTTRRLVKLYHSRTPWSPKGLVFSRPMMPLEVSYGSYDHMAWSEADVSNFKFTQDHVWETRDAVARIDHETGKLTFGCRPATNEAMRWNLYPAEGHVVQFVCRGLDHVYKAQVVGWVPRDGALLRAHGHDDDERICLNSSVRS